MSSQTNSTSNCTSNLNDSTATAATLPVQMGEAAIINATLPSDQLVIQELWTLTWVDTLNGNQILEAISGVDYETHVSD
jgi:hypothetical protein